MNDTGKSDVSRTKAIAHMIEDALITSGFDAHVADLDDGVVVLVSDPNDVASTYVVKTYKVQREGV